MPSSLVPHPSSPLDAARAIARADALVIAAGAGMGVDSGLPDFRGPEGFWNAYPAFEELGYSFRDLAVPRWFADDPELAWGFYGHRLELYRQAAPHAGFAILHDWAQKMHRGYFIYTSNVDGHFQKAGFADDQVLECHGTIHYLQCSLPCRVDIWPTGDTTIDLDRSTMRASEPLPRCPHCGAVARPNILLFGDNQWIWDRTEGKRARLNKWFAGLERMELVVIEIGAGTAVPTVRHFAEDLQGYGATLIRINPREPEGPEGTISIALPALEALRAIQVAIPPNP